MSEPQEVPTHRYTTCATCTNEVRADFYDEGPVQCEFCSGAVKPLHAALREERKVVDPTPPAANAAFLERLDAVLTRAVPDPDRPGAFGRCKYCGIAYVLTHGQLAHPGTCFPRKPT